MRRAVLAGLAILAIALVTPVSVLAGALLGSVTARLSGSSRSFGGYGAAPGRRPLIGRQGRM